MFPSSSEGWDPPPPTLLVPLERTNLNHSHPSPDDKNRASFQKLCFFRISDWQSLLSHQIRESHTIVRTFRLCYNAMFLEVARLKNKALITKFVLGARSVFCWRVDTVPVCSYSETLTSNHIGIRVSEYEGAGADVGLLKSLPLTL
jgi:hypothetical protein